MSKETGPNVSPYIIQLPVRKLLLKLIIYVIQTQDCASFRIDHMLNVCPRTIEKVMTTSVSTKHEVLTSQYKK